MTRIGIVDDHPFVIKGLSAILSMEEALEIAWTAQSESEAFARLKEEAVDILIIDLKMGQAAGGLEILKFLQTSGIDAKAIVLSAFAQARMVREAARLGARGYFTKEEGGEELLGAIRSLIVGEHCGFLGPYGHLAKPSPYLDISARERDVLVEISKGNSNAKVAAELGLKVGTVKTHLESIFNKLGVSNRTDALRAALADGIIHLDEIA